jgi:rod shape-determining protein MreC
MQALSGARRSQFLLLGLVVAHLVAISWQVETKGGVSLLERIGLSVVSPFQRALAATMGGIGSTFGRYVALRGVREENARLTARVQALELALQEQRQLAEQAVRLRALLGLREQLPFETITAELIASEGAPWASTITVDKGSGDGITLNMPAISSSGIVGRVIAVGLHAAKVQLILHPVSGVGVMIERSRTLGVLEGLSSDTESGDLRMRFVPALADVQVGDTVVTSGLDQIYPKGLIVGVVSRVRPPAGLIKDVYVVPSTRFHEMEEVLLVRVTRQSTETPEAVR